MKYLDAVIGLLLIWILWMLIPKKRYAIVDTEAYRARQIDF